jgi:hypothetical protein
MFVRWIIFNRSATRHRNRTANFPPTIQLWFSGEDKICLWVGWICWRCVFRLVLVARSSFEEDEGADSQTDDDDNATNGNTYNCANWKTMAGCFVA